MNTAEKRVNDIEDVVFKSRVRSMGLRLAFGLHLILLISLLIIHFTFILFHRSLSPVVGVLFIVDGVAIITFTFAYFINLYRFRREKGTNFVIRRDDNPVSGTFPFLRVDRQHGSGGTPGGTDRRPSEMADGGS